LVRRFWACAGLGEALSWAALASVAGPMPPVEPVVFEVTLHDEDVALE
jgi:hypothetical protein